MCQGRTSPLKPVLVRSDSLGSMDGNDQNISPKDLYVQQGAPAALTFVKDVTLTWQG